MLTHHQLRETLIVVLDHWLPACAQKEYRLVGTAVALLQDVPVPTGDVDLLLKERESVDAFGLALASFECRFLPAWIPRWCGTEALVCRLVKVTFPIPEGARNASGSRAGRLALLPPHVRSELIVGWRCHASVMGWSQNGQLREKADTTTSQDRVQYTRRDVVAGRARRRHRGNVGPKRTYARGREPLACGCVFEEVAT
jgi:hypothetical protein